jgi:hypothetical protein
MVVGNKLVGEWWLLCGTLRSLRFDEKTAEDAEECKETLITIP